MQVMASPISSLNATSTPTASLPAASLLYSPTNPGLYSGNRLGYPVVPNYPVYQGYTYGMLPYGPYRDTLQPAFLPAPVQPPPPMATPQESLVKPRASLENEFAKPPSEQSSLRIAEDASLLELSPEAAKRKAVLQAAEKILTKHPEWLNNLTTEQIEQFATMVDNPVVLAKWVLQTPWGQKIHREYRNLGSALQNWIKKGVLNSAPAPLRPTAEALFKVLAQKPDPTALNPL